MKKKFYNIFSIRTKLTLVSLLLLLIPFMSYVYVRDMKSFLIKGQEDALSLTARAISTVLHDRPELFSKKTNEERENNTTDVYVVPLSNYVRLDGDLSDWGDQLQQAKDILAPDQNKPSKTESKGEIEASHLLGYRGSYLYAFFQVNDSSLILREKDALRLDTADHIRLAIKAPFQAETRYSFTARKPGSMSVYLMDDNWSYPLDGNPNRNIKAELKKTDNGYIIEARIPRFMLSNNASIQLQIADIDKRITPDKSEPSPARIISTTTQTKDDQANDFAKILLQTPEVDNILKGLKRSDARIWVLDSDKNVRTVVGNLSSKIFTQNEESYSQYKWIASIQKTYNSILNKVFSLILEEADSKLSDYEQDTQERSDKLLEKALEGNLSTDRRESLDKQTTIIMAANPIWSGSDIIGSVIVEQSSHEVLSKQRETLENVISVTLIVLLVVLSSILYFASRLTIRISRLRDSTESAIDRYGRPSTGTRLRESRASDEIGDLSRSIGGMLTRLSQYTQYLRGLPDTLAHEVSNPLNVVNSSLENLALEYDGSRQSNYFKRAQKGLNRIQAILKNLTEAANLEQAMAAQDFVMFDVSKLVENYTEVYQSSNPDNTFVFDALVKPMMIEGAPDYIARREEEIGFIEVINVGKKLPKGMAERIFEPMVSLGRTDAKKTRLGMGLYIVRLISTFHGGNVKAKNLESGTGVTISVSLPIASELNDSIMTPPSLTN